MRTQGWWLNVAKRIGSSTGRRQDGFVRYAHYCSVWLGDNRGGEEEKRKAQEIVTLYRDAWQPEDFKFTLSEEWISGKEHPL